MIRQFRVVIAVLLFLSLPCLASLDTELGLHAWENQILSGFDFERDQLCFENDGKWKVKRIEYFAASKIANYFGACHGMIYLAKFIYEKRNEVKKYADNNLSLKSKIRERILYGSKQDFEFKKGEGLKELCKESRNFFIEMSLVANKQIGSRYISYLLPETFLLSYSLEENDREMKKTIRLLSQEFRKNKTVMLHYRYHTVLAYKMDIIRWKGRVTAVDLYTYDPNILDGPHVFRIHFDRKGKVQHFFQEGAPAWAILVE